MDPVQITMLGVGVALAALVVTLNGSLRRDMDKRFDAIEKRCAFRRSHRRDRRARASTGSTRASTASTRACALSNRAWPR